MVMPPTLDINIGKKIPNTFACCYLSSACWDASHKHTMCMLTHTLPLSNSYILYTRTLMSIPTQKIYTAMYIHIHKPASTQYLSQPSSASQTHYQPPSTQISTPLHEFRGPPRLPLFTVILPLYICLSLSLFLCLSFLFSGFLLPVDPVLFLDSNPL